MRWINDSTDCSEAGSSIRAHSTSSNNRGDVAPDMSGSPRCSTSAKRVNVPVGTAVACSRIASTRSSGASTSPSSIALGTAAMTSRSRTRPSRSSANRFGSCPDRTTRSTHPNSAARSVSASARIASSSRLWSVTPSSPAARSYDTPSGPAPASSWSITDSESRGEPPPARTTSGNTSSATGTCSSPTMRSNSPRIRFGGNNRNG